MRAKQAWHMRCAAFDAALRITPPHQTQTTFGLPSPFRDSMSPVSDAIRYPLEGDGIRRARLYPVCRRTNLAKKLLNGGHEMLPGIVHFDSIFIGPAGVAAVTRREWYHKLMALTNFMLYGARTHLKKYSRPLNRRRSGAGAAGVQFSGRHP
jgi:hypothetical protein